MLFFIIGMNIGLQGHTILSLVPRPPQAFNRGFGFKIGLGLIDFVLSSLRQVDLLPSLSRI